MVLQIYIDGFWFDMIWHDVLQLISQWLYLKVHRQATYKLSNKRLYMASIFFYLIKVKSRVNSLLLCLVLYLSPPGNQVITKKTYVQ